MRYLGGKAKVAPRLCAAINAVIRETKPLAYVEPFVGAGNVMAGILAHNRVAYDAHPDLILLWQALQQGWAPPTHVTREEYEALRNAEPSALRAFVGFGLSYGGKWFGGYLRDNPARGEYHAQAARNGLLRRIRVMQDVSFAQADYRAISCVGAVIYCDPPYAGTTAFKGLPVFDHAEFWDWCRKMARQNVVLVSERAAPPDCELIASLAPTQRGMMGQTDNLYRLERSACATAW